MFGEENFLDNSRQPNVLNATNYSIMELQAETQALTLDRSALLFQGQKTRNISNSHGAAGHLMHHKCILTHFWE